MTKGWCGGNHFPVRSDQRHGLKKKLPFFMDWLWLLETNKICEQQEKAGKLQRKFCEVFERKFRKKQWSHI